VKLIGAAHTDRGRVRRENQDSYGFDAGIGLYLVADGMGGRAGGKRASEEAARVVAEAVAASAASGTDGAGRLTHAIERANAHVWELSQSDPLLHGMGTTIAALLVEGETAHVAHVGDSRVYRLRGEAIAPLTRDHSYLVELAGQGADVADPRVRARFGSLLTRAVGVEPTVEVDALSEPILAGDVFLLCSDGVYRMVAPGELAAIVAAKGDDLAAACAAIVARANDAGGSDNSTVILLRAAPDAGGAPGATP
jgi:serine/threonine protein phosphatase PrpC